MLSQARRFVTLGVGGYVYYLITRYFSLPLMDASHWFTWVLATVLYDLCYYWLHRMGHERTILWAAHVAHHQSEDYNLTTALRQTSTGFLLGWIFYIPMYLLGIPAEVVVTVGAINLLPVLGAHRARAEAGLVRVGVRHPVEPPGAPRPESISTWTAITAACLYLWDRLFGTFQEDWQRAPVYGFAALKAGTVRALTHIYVDMFGTAGTARWRDKLRVWVPAPAGARRCGPAFSPHQN